MTCCEATWKTKIEVLFFTVLSSIFFGIGCSHYGLGSGQEGQPCLSDGSCNDGSFCDETGNCVAATSLGEYTFTRQPPSDLLFVVDNSRSMQYKQETFAESLANKFELFKCLFGKDLHLAVTSTGIESSDCPPCDELNTMSCINDTGEGGLFQNRLGHYDGDLFSHEYSFTTDPQCPAIMLSPEFHCLYDQISESGIILTGDYGCGYERGLEAIRLALGELQSSQPGFLRKDAQLVIVVLSDEEDCGAVGDIEEGVAGIRAKACYYAAKGQDPDGNEVKGLTPVKEYHDFLLSLKDNKEGMVKFLAFVGMKDPKDPSSTKIEYTKDPAGSTWNIKPACEVPRCARNCDASNESCLSACKAFPGTRYIELAQMFGYNGAVDTICQNDFFSNLSCSPSACPSRFKLSSPVENPENIHVYINGQLQPAYSCSVNSDSKLQSCQGPADKSCPDGSLCVPTWTYSPPVDSPPDPAAPGGYVDLAQHFQPCEMSGYGSEIKIEIVMIEPEQQS